MEVTHTAKPFNLLSHTVLSCSTHREISYEVKISIDGLSIDGLSIDGLMQI